MRIDNNWFALEITVDSNATEAIEFALNELDALGTEINNLGKKPTKTLTVIGYFNEKPHDETVEDQIAEALRIYGYASDAVRAFAWSEVENIDWLAEWKRHWKPTTVGRFIVAPPWECIEETGKIVIRIEPNMAFGTGTHDTTKLCLKAIGERYQAGQTVLDVGTGTGILAIATAKLGARTIVGCDTDEDSIKIARENAVLNGVDWIEFADGTLAADAPVYDFVCANLTVDVIVPILGLLLAKTGSILLLSGILVEQKDIISDALREFQISNYKFETSGEWISVLVRTGNDSDLGFDAGN